MVLSRLLAAAALSAALAVPASVGADQRPTAGHQPAAHVAVSQTKVPVARIAASKTQAPSLLNAAAAVARRYWGAVACQGRVKVLAQRPLAPGLDPGSDAWVTFDSALGANNLAAPASGYTNCTIAFGRSRWPTPASMQEDWDVFCLTMIHEVGHLLGHSHDSTPGSVMAPVFTSLSSVPAICRATRPARTAGSAQRR